MTTWAIVASADAPSAAAEASAVQPVGGRQPTVVVVDANALISGVRPDTIGDRAVTTAEVLEEVRDKQTRKLLATLPFGLEALQPSEESVKAVMRFARATGDLHSLSAADVRLIALAHSLEVATHGEGHLRSSPTLPKVQTKPRSSDARALPGWGEDGAQWAELDQLHEDDLAAAEAARGGEGVSRITQAVEALDLSGQAEGHYDANGGEEQGVLGGGSLSAAGEEGEEGDAAGWELARRSGNAVRHRRRKDVRCQQWEMAQQQHSAPAGEAAGSEQALAEEGHLEPHGSAAPSPDAADVSSTEFADEEDESGSSSGSDAESGSDSDGSTGRDGHKDDSDARGQFESSIASVTADFAMQNVILQMGLRLVTPDGRRITHLSRWVLRCSACFTITKEVGRLFCPKCGNATLDKVEVFIGPDGAEQYGVKKKHILRGTRYSLPKPKGGRSKGQVALREDVLLSKAPRHKPKAAEATDPFAPEYGPDSWFQKNTSAPLHAKGAAALLAAWRHNPNERRHVRTNRRRK